MKKISNSCIYSPILRAVLDKWGGLPIGPKWTDLKIFQQNQNSKGVCLMKEIANSCIWGPTVQITVFLAPDPAGFRPSRPSAERKKILRHTFLPKWMQKKSAQMDERRQSY